jgi:hypothetical protein
VLPFAAEEDSSVTKRLPAMIFVTFSCLALASGAVLADEVPWTYVEGGYNNVDLDNLGDEGDGWFVGASFGMKHFHFFGRRVDSETDASVDLTTWYAGGGWHGLFGERTDVFGDLAYVSTEFGSASEDGYFARAGIRWRPIGFIELGASGRWQDLESDEDVVWEGNAIFYFWRIGIGVNYEKADEVETYNAFARFVFL